ncbi:hypothetical protein DFQ29_009133 [Apophysomyces sp. BC1021]|nr:hypothetical protein DFQ29_009133 [Apophysomyces sp. BC1021]
MTPGRDLSSLVSRYSQEIPATAPVFEGYLYLRTEKKQWHWRLFRFDGSSFTCLSTRKVKLPPNTAVDVQDDDLQFSFMHVSPSYASLTSPLLATPKESLLNQTAPLANYYQLPIFTVDVTNISAVSLLKRSKKAGGLFSSSTRPSRCFCIRTFDDQCFVMKAQKQKDLERWLFVLTKMLQFAQAIRRQMTRQSEVYPPLMMKKNHPSVIVPQDQMPLVRTIPTTSAAVAAISPAAHPPPPRIPKSNDDAPYDRKYQAPALSSEKTQWIDEWRKSLAELIAYDPNIKVSPPPIEPIPDDDKMSMLSGMTSISKCERPRRRSTAGSIRSYRSLSRRMSAAAAAAATQEKPLGETKQQQQPGTLKKKRSDDVKNWIEPIHRLRNENEIKRSGSQQSVRLVRPMNRKPMIQRVASVRGPSSSPEIYHVDFFQDVATTCTDDTEAKSMLQTIRYHASIRGKHVQVVRNDGDNDNGHSNSSGKIAGNIPRRASMPLGGYHDHLLGDDDEKNNPLYSMSPLQSLSRADNAYALMAEKEEDEEMSLADLQRSLKRVHRKDSWGHARSPSASTVLDIQKQQQQQQQLQLQQLQQQQQQQHLQQLQQLQQPAWMQIHHPFARGSAFAAPAIPPVNLAAGETSYFYPPTFDATEKHEIRLSQQQQRGKQRDYDERKHNIWVANTWSTVATAKTAMPHPNKVRPQSLMVPTGSSLEKQRNRRSMDPLVNYYKGTN